MTTRPDISKLRVDDHFFDLTLAPRETVRQPLTPEAMQRIGKTIAVVAGADGELSPMEQATLHGRGLAFGMPAALVEEVMKFDYRSARIEDLYDESMRAVARIILHEVVAIARSDGFGDKERQAAVKAAKTLGIVPGLVGAIEGVLDVEEAVRAARIKLLLPSGRPLPAASLGGGEPHPQSQRWAAISQDLEDYLRRERYGITGPLPYQVGMDIGKAILIVAGADGDLSEGELKWFLGMTRALGAQPEDVADFVRFDYRHARLEDHLTPQTRQVSKVILYEAMNVSRADGFHEKERTAAVRAAELLGLDPTIVPAIEGLQIMENAVRQARIRVLSDG